MTIRPDMADEEHPEESLRSGFPQSPSSFAADPRVSFSKLDNKFILETEEGNEFEWDTALKRWIPVVGNTINGFRAPGANLRLACSALQYS